MDVMRSKVKGEKWNKFWKSGANSQKIRDKKTLPQLMSEQQLHTTNENLGNKPHKNLKGGI